MASIGNKIDFAVVFTVTNANPNGDPLNGNRPRVGFDGRGEVSDVCIKRKIRNRLQDLGLDVFVQSDDRRTDDAKSLKERADSFITSAGKDEEEFVRSVCEKWIDVRAFGQLFAFKKKTGDAGVSIGIRGPVSVHPAFSLSPINITSTQITKSVNSETGDKKGSDTMGMKHRVDCGTYVFYGSINPQLARKTGFSDQDAAKFKEALTTLFENDSSSARPEGSMDIHRVIWWKHNSPNGQYSSGKVHNSLKIAEKRGKENNAYGILDYDIVLEKLEGLEPEVYEN